MRVHPPSDPLFIILPLIVLVIDVAMVVYCLNDLYKPERRVAGGNKDTWAFIIIIIGMVGWIAYLYFGRENA
ncbi:MAG TPA: PLDc N-terminal domain-containing protein [Ktedonobacterales bacterium]